MLFLLTFLGLSVARRPKVTKYVQFAHPSPRIYNDVVGCEMCQSIIKYIHKLLNDKTVESEIETLLSSFCTSFPSPYDTLCKALTESYVPTIIEWIDQGISSNDICSKFGFCTSQKKVARKFPGQITLPKNPKYVKGTGCELCKKLVEYIEKLLEDKTVDEELVNLAKQLCTTFPSPYDSLCNTVVTQYLPFIIKWIDSGLQTSDICKTIGLCETKLRKAVRIPSRIILPNDYQNGIGCDMCKKVVQYIEQLLNDQKTEEEIALLVEELCTFFPSPYDSLCGSVCEQYIPTIMQLIEQGIESLDICSSIGLCTSSKPKKANKKRVVYGKMALPSPRIYNNAIGCDMCKKVVQYIEQLLKDEKVEEEIAQLVSTLCTNFPSPYDSLCKGIVELYVPQIIEYIEKDIEAIDICYSIGLCNEEIVSKIKRQKARAVSINRLQQRKQTYISNSEESCETCKKWFKWATDKLSDITVEGLWKLIHEECPKVPYLKYFCEIINEQNIKTFVDLIVAQVPPEKACGWTHLC